MNQYSSTTDHVYDKNIARNGRHQDLGKFAWTDDQFLVILEIVKIGGSILPSELRPEHRDNKSKRV